MALKSPNLKSDIKPTAQELGKRDQLVALTCGEQSSGRVKSYTCTFCRRCFSNSQALGGHMNIHRKERARLKELSGDDLLSLGIGTKDASNKPPTISNDKLFELQSKEGKSGSKKRSYHLSEDLNCSSIPKEVVDDDRLQLSLFAEATSTTSYEEVSNCIGGQVGANYVPFDTRASYAQLDLELRLGPEPHETR